MELEEEEAATINAQRAAKAEKAAKEAEAAKTAATDKHAIDDALESRKKGITPSGKPDPAVHLNRNTAETTQQQVTVNNHFHMEAPSSSVSRAGSSSDRMDVEPSRTKRPASDYDDDDDDRPSSKRGKTTQDSSAVAAPAAALPAARQGMNPMEVAMLGASVIGLVPMLPTLITSAKSGYDKLTGKTALLTAQCQSDPTQTQCCKLNPNLSQCATLIPSS